MSCLNPPVAVVMGMQNVFEFLNEWLHCISYFILLSTKLKLKTFLGSAEFVEPSSEKWVHIVMYWANVADSISRLALDFYEHRLKGAVQQCAPMATLPLFSSQEAKQIL